MAKLIVDILAKILSEESVDELFLKKNGAEMAEDEDSADTQKAFSISCATIKTAYSEAKNDREKILYLQTIKRIITDDIVARYRSNFFLENPPTKHSAYQLIPDWYRKEGKSISLEEGAEEVDLKKVPTLVIPWKTTRLLSAANRKSDFKYDETNHKGSYYPTLNLAVISGGNHSIAEGIINREEAKVELRKINETELFRHVKTDGAYWIAKETDEKIMKVFEFRVAVLYWVQEELNKIEKGNQI